MISLELFFSDALLELELAPLLTSCTELDTAFSGFKLFVVVLDNKVEAARGDAIGNYAQL